MVRNNAIPELPGSKITPRLRAAGVHSHDKESSPIQRGGRGLARERGKGGSGRTRRAYVPTARRGKDTLSRTTNATRVGRSKIAASPHDRLSNFSVHFRHPNPQGCWPWRT